MKKIALMAGATAFFGAGPASAGELMVSVSGVEQGKPIPAKFAYCRPDGQGKTQNGGNINPAISWPGAPEGTKSYAVIVVDRDVPKTFELANKEGKTIPADFPRRDFFHWVLVDIPPAIQGIAEGQDSNRVVEGGKKPGSMPYGLSGHNDYAPSHGGYDGPCPPWNDERLHHYHFQVYALDVPSLNLSGGFGGAAAMRAMDGHVLAMGEVVGTYTNKTPR